MTQSPLVPGTVSGPVSRLRDQLKSLDRAYSPGHHGRWSSGRRTEMVDRALIELFAGPALGDRTARVALVALGGYGRAALVPGSDVDLMVLHDGTDPEAVAALADALLYPLWDGGFEVGHAVRTPAEAEEIGRERLDVLTAELDLRRLAGDGELARDAATRVLAIVREDPRAFAEQLQAASADRHRRYGSTANLLEPDIKDGAGALRDMHTLGWLERAVRQPLETAGLLREREREALDEAEEFLTRVRSSLHLLAGRRTDRLAVDRQAEIAEAMGFENEPRLLAVDALMRAVFEHARQIAYVSDAVFERFFADGRAEIGPDLVLTGEGILQALADTAEAGGFPSVSTLDRLDAAALPTDVEWTDGIREAFLRILRAGEPGVAALDALDRLGLLVRFLPAWAGVRCRPQRDPYHRLTVDAHLTEALVEMSRMLGHGDSGDRVEREAVKQIDDRDALLLGALLHDIGKIGEGGHVAVGARIADDLLGRMRVGRSTHELALFMVAEHLLLPDTATRRDLTDDDLILGVAARVGSPQRLAALYLLAKADAAATGPSAWTPWRRTLIRELVAKIQRVFDRGEMGTELAERLADRVGRVRDLLTNEPESEVDRFVLRMPRGYFLSVDPARSARHFSTIAPRVGANEVRTVTASGSRAGTHELLVVAVDRPGLLSWIAGALSLAGLSILTAQVFTTEDGVAVDLFEVEGAWEPEVRQERWREFRRVLRGTIEGTISLGRRVDEKRRHYPPPRTDLAVSVAVDNRASDFFTVIEIGAADRIGLLYDITSAFADLSLDVHLAKVSTFTGRVIDAFYVRDSLGRKVTESHHVGEIEALVRARLAG
ncbi:MAG: ACT domain-containing protein [Actinomycetota bacterium]|nr:ACT domain-containing protein [Actinomycetota bacterium]